MKLWIIFITGFWKPCLLGMVVGVIMTFISKPIKKQLLYSFVFTAVLISIYFVFDVGRYWFMYLPFIILLALITCLIVLIVIFATDNLKSRFSSKADDEEKTMLAQKSKASLILLLILGVAGSASALASMFGVPEFLLPEYEHYESDATKYDVAKKDRWPPFQEWEFPPLIPGTEGQMMARVQVVDISTKQPIAGAIVVGGYEGLDGRGGLSCFASESAVTDENGYAWLPNDRDERVRDGKYWRRGPRLVSAYKRGYQLIYPPFFSRYNYDDKAWYVYERTPPEMLPYTVKRDSDGRAPWERKRLPGSYPDERSALLASKERSTIYLYPSTAKTKEERWKELSDINRPCVSKQPFNFSESEGGFPVLKAIYQELKDMGVDEKTLEYFEDHYLILFRDIDQYKSDAKKAARGEIK